MNKTLNVMIEQSIEYGLTKKKRGFIIYPAGYIGIKVANILRTEYGIEPQYVVDDNKLNWNDLVRGLDVLNNIDCKEYVVILACTNETTFPKIKTNMLSFFPSENIIELECVKGMTICGRHSYGPLCQHVYVESVGSFCCFAKGVNVVPNHPVDMISIHPFLYYGEEMGIFYEDFASNPGIYVPGVHPRGARHKTVGDRARIRIGNDVWLGANVIITNGANIGNGVIAGACTVITKDVPDYAVVVGNPARIIRYRYTDYQIKKLNEIAWWDWSDEMIQERYDDFYLPIDEFIAKYSKSSNDECKLSENDYKAEVSFTYDSIEMFNGGNVDILGGNMQSRVMHSNRK